MSIDTLPDGWTRVKFGDVARNVNENSRDLAADGLDRVVGLDHLDPGSLRLTRWDDHADLPDGTTFTRKFEPGQVLFGKRRAYQRKVAVPDFEGVCSGDILVFEPADERLLTEFLPYLVQSDGFFDHALGTSAGSLSPRTKWVELAKYEFALPPIKEQQRIVEVIAAVDKHISCLTKQVDVACIARTAVLSELLSAVGDDWIQTTLGEVAELNPEATTNFHADRVIRYIDLSSVSHEAGISPNLTEVEYGDAPGRARRVVRAADVLVSTVRPYLKGFAQVPKHLDGEVASTGFAVVRAKPETTLAGFVWALVGTADFVLHLMDRATGSNYPAVRPEDIASYTLMLPPIEQQRQIVEIISSTDEVIQSAENAVVATKILRSGLLTVLLAGGEL